MHPYRRSTEQPDGRTYFYPPLDICYSPIISTICGPNKLSIGGLGIVNVLIITLFASIIILNYNVFIYDIIHKYSMTFLVQDVSEVR